VQPRESSHFEFYELGQDKLVVPLSNSSLYTEDWLGLRELDAGGRLLRLECDGDHLQMPAGWFEANIIPLLA
jgi:palmitoyl-protein thioesterase